ncbi:MAG: hypothetical protein Q4A79_02530 [Candidatus Saccharibacteria bacterium]|nr:hypothetical protein [Candidatus Saccharibacteria bacterium]
MNILDIYNKYHLPENLQMHMLVVAACGNLIIDSWTGKEIDKDMIIRVCLLHNMGNIVKISEGLSNDKEFLPIRKKYVDKYGPDALKTNLEIGEAEGLTDKELMILDEKRYRKSEKTLNSDSYELKICAYCDLRVSQNSVIDVKSKLEEARARYKNNPSSIWSDEEKANRLIDCALGIEKQIMENCNISPEDINDKSIEKYVNKLREYNIMNYR